jgi:hypothetical protein
VTILFFFFPILWPWWTSNHPQENLAKFGYSRFFLKPWQHSSWLPCHFVLCNFDSLTFNSPKKGANFCSKLGQTCAMIDWLIDKNWCIWVWATCISCLNFVVGLEGLLVWRLVWFLHPPTQIAIFDPHLLFFFFFFCFLWELWLDLFLFLLCCGILCFSLVSILGQVRCCLSVLV